MYGKCHRRLFEVDAVMTRRVVLVRAGRVDRCNKIHMRGANRCYRCWRWGIWLDRRNLRERSGGWAEVVRKRRPPLA